MVPTPPGHSAQSGPSHLPPPEVPPTPPPSTQAKLEHQALFWMPPFPSCSPRPPLPSQSRVLLPKVCGTCPLLATLMAILLEPHSYPDGWYPASSLQACPSPQPTCPLAARRLFLRPTAPGSTLLRLLLPPRKKSESPGFTRPCPLLSHPCSPSSLVTPSLISKGSLGAPDGASHNWEIILCVIICLGTCPLACEFREGRDGKGLSPCGFRGLAQAWHRARAE